ncbi:MAG: T9SS type A sorting domain-containing protein, partial [Cyclobacteriaceae bacterium]|nr:T9SS type A sorting domain-containing protein [Cyclobacteriaceae bacterium]
EIDSDDQNPSWTSSDPGEYHITLITTNDLQSDTLTKFGFITVNHGYLVYEGEPDGEGYSGTFIRDYMEENDYYSVTYRNEFPDDLEGYHAVFLSFGNYSSGNTYLEDNMADIIINYLEGGGYVYIEGGSTFYNQRDNVEFLELFGLEEQVYPAYNPINYLEGQADALTVDQVFTSTSQQAIDWVGRYEPNESGIIAFEESDFGTVAVQNTGDYNQRTFCFSYTLADLDDGEFPNTRDELLGRICDFFDIFTTVYSPVEEKLELEIYPNPTKSESIIRYYLAEESVVSIDIFEITGKFVISLVNRVQPKGNKQVLFNISSFSEGIYFLRLDTGNETVTKKIIKVR